MLNVSILKKICSFKFVKWRACFQINKYLNPSSVFADVASNFLWPYGGFAVDIQSGVNIPPREPSSPLGANSFC
jgi:hypothetical protein